MARRGPGRGRAFVRALATLALGIALLLGFAFAFFPFERLEPALAARIGAATRSRATFGQLSVGWELRGPFAELHALTLRWSDGSTLMLDTLRVEPALSAAWLRGVPTASVKSLAAFGSVDGIVSREVVQLRAEQLEVSALPKDWFGESGAPIDGRVDATLAATRVAEQWSGRLSIQGADGVLALPGAPVAIPYESLRGTLALDELGTLTLAGIALAGPMASATAEGTIAAGYAGPATGALDVAIDVKRIDPALVPSLTAAGIPLDPSGTGRLHMTGSVDQPAFQ